MLSFNSRDIKYKKPFGAVTVGQQIKISFPTPDAFIHATVTMILRHGNDNQKYQMTLDRHKKTFVLKFQVDMPGVYFYRFEIEDENGIKYVGRDEQGSAIIGEWLPEWQLSVYEKNYKTPDWLKGGLIYHIFADRFARVDDEKLPRFGRLKSWYEDLTIADWDGVYRANDFYGGNIKGIISKLDYLAELSINAIYLSPVYKSSSNHRYDVGDYMTVDPLFGDEDEFVDLVCECKKRGIYVIMDGVFNHTGADSIYFNKFGHYDEIGAYQSKNSKYYDWYSFEEFPDKYACWWGITVVPSIRRDSTSFRQFIAGDNGVIEKWTKLGVQGWRLDVVDELSSDFVKEIRTKIKSLAKDVAVIGEVWEDASTKVSYSEEREYFYGRELDGVMNYPFCRAIIEYILNSDAMKFKNEVMDIMENYPAHALECCMTIIGTHDTTRIINVLSETKPSTDKVMRLGYRLNYNEYKLGLARVKLASVMQYFLPGVPVIYYGDEIGMQGFDDPINRRPMVFGNESELLSHYIKLGKLRKENRADFKGGLLINIREDGMIELLRGALVAYINPTTEEILLPVATYDILEDRTICSILPLSAIVTKTHE